jgi:L-lactate dehydrogenase complex protein LldF
VNKTAVTIPLFRAAAASALADARLQGALKGATGRFREARAAALAELPEVEALRDHLKAVRAAAIANLAGHLEEFERNATAAGAQVHWARDGAEACRIITDIALANDVTLAAKSKSMATEEIHLNEALLAAGVIPVETDLGEWIIQLDGDPPYHIIAPAIHKTKEQVAELFERETGLPQSADDIGALTQTARLLLREKFLAAGMGISGGNLGVAESGSVVLVTNEGNGRMVTTLPPVHVAVLGIEKIAPTWDDAAAWLALLARSATGQPMSIYTTAVSGPARPADADGPRQVHIVLLDNGRSRLLNTPYEEVLQCLRCGACLNSCPVYREAGGHAYGSPYSGPIGAVITPLLFGLEKYPALPHASTLCGECKVVCPVRIDLPRMLLELRAEEAELGLLAPLDSLAEKAAAFVMGGSRRWALGAGLLRQAQRPFLHDAQIKLPQTINLTLERRLPGVAPKSFRRMWADGDVEGE